MISSVLPFQSDCPLVRSASCTVKGMTVVEVVVLSPAAKGAAPKSGYLIDREPHSVIVGPISKLTTKCWGENSSECRNVQN